MAEHELGFLFVQDQQARGGQHFDLADGFQRSQETGHVSIHEAEFEPMFVGRESLTSAGAAA